MASILEQIAKKLELDTADAEAFVEAVRSDFNEQIRINYILQAVEMIRSRRKTVLQVVKKLNGILTEKETAAFEELGAFLGLDSEANSRFSTIAEERLGYRLSYRELLSLRTYAPVPVRVDKRAEVRVRLGL